MKLGATVAAFALIGAAASTSTFAAEWKDVPQTTTAPNVSALVAKTTSSGLTRPAAPKSRTGALEAKAGPAPEKMMSQPPTSGLTK
jgi:hypothetical protein